MTGQHLSTWIKTALEVRKLKSTAVNPRLTEAMNAVKRGKAKYGISTNILHQALVTLNKSSQPVTDEEHQALGRALLGDALDGSVQVQSK